MSDNFFKIVNRSKEYLIDKEKLASIDYFNSMFNHTDMIETQRNEIVFDINESVFEAFINIYGYGINSVVKCEWLLAFYDLMDFFGISDQMLKCKRYFNRWFTLNSLHIFLPQVTSTSILLNKATLDDVICRHFVRIASSPDWNTFPIETILEICSKDVLIFSEQQVFDCLVSWIRSNKPQHCDRERLLKLVRWVHLDADINSVAVDLDDIGIPVQLVENIKTEQSGTVGLFNRAKQFYQILIFTNGVIHLYDDDLTLKTSRRITKSVSKLGPFPEEHCTDVWLSRGGIIRIDWLKNEYIYINEPDYLDGVHNFFYKNKDTKYLDQRLKFACQIRGRCLQDSLKDTILFNGCGTTLQLKSTNSCGLSELEGALENHTPNEFRVTLFANNIFILAQKFNLKVFNCETGAETTIRLDAIATKGREHSGLYLAAKSASEILIFDEESGEFFLYDFEQQKTKIIGALLQDFSEKNPVFDFATIYVPKKIVESFEN